MNEIRLCWVAIQPNGSNREPVECGEWRVATEATRRELEEILNARIRVWGEGSHWMQEREMAPMQNPFAASV